MIGVVIWEKEDRGQAVIWCQDIASLTYLESRAHLKDPDYWPRSGDLVEMSNKMIGTTRYARGVTLLPPESTPKVRIETDPARVQHRWGLTLPPCDGISRLCKPRCDS